MMCVELTQQAPVWRGPGSPEIAVYFGKNHIFETWRTRESVRSLGFSHSRLASIPKINVKFRGLRNPTPAKAAGMGHPRSGSLSVTFQKENK